MIVRSIVLLAATAGLAVACAGTSPFDRARVAAELERRSGIQARFERRPAPSPGATEGAVPPGVRMDDGLTEDEAVAMALWNNATFLADLATLDLARGDLVEAGMIRNPLLTLLLPLGPKQLEFTAAIPLEALWQRPRRIAAAQKDVERVAQGLVQSALDLIRDVKVGVSDVALADDKIRIGQHARELTRGISAIAEARRLAGDLSDLERETIRIDVARADQDLVLLEQDAAAARERLRLRLGLVGTSSSSLRVVVSPVQGNTRQPIEAALKMALALRPDLRAAEIAIEAAAARVGWEKSRALGLVAALADANGQGKQGFEIGPGLLMEIPLWNRNQGGIARARAEVDRAAWQYVVARQRIESEVRLADGDSASAQRALAILREQSLATAEENVRRAERGYEAGEVSQLYVLEVARQRLDLALRAAELEARLRRSTAELERSLGGKRVPTK